MKQFVEMVIMDIKMTYKSFMSLFLLIIPLVILLVLKGFLPSVEDTTETIAVVTEGPLAVQEEMVKTLGRIADVKKYATLEEVKKKMNGYGSAEGLYWDPERDQYVSLVERTLKGNTSFSTASRIIRQALLKKEFPGEERATSFYSHVPEELKDRSEIPPVASMGGAVFIVYLLIIMGFVIGLSIVTDKEYGTNKAIRVSPVTKAEYFFGRVVHPVLIILVYTIICLLLLRLMEVNILQVYVIVIASLLTTLFFGLVLGGLAHNETEGIGYGKMLGMVSLLSLLGGILMPDNWKWVVYWVPLYWIFDNLQDVFTHVSTWASVFWKSGVIIGTTLVYFFLLRKKLLKGLS